MTLVDSIILGVMQGLLEWLPVSSEGQLMVAMISWLHISASSAFSLAIFLHLGSACAVILKFRNTFFGMLRDIRNSVLLRLVVISTLFTGVTAVPLLLLIRGFFDVGEWAAIFIGVMLLATGLILKLQNHGGLKELDDISLFDMVLLGMIQGFAILPGISRSGVTVTTLLVRGVEQRLSMTISFLISVPVIIGAVVFEGASNSFAGISAVDAFVMFAVSLAVSYAAMDILLKLAEEVNFSNFCIILGLIAIVLSLGPIMVAGF